MSIHLWQYVSGARSWSHGGLGSPTERCVMAEREGTSGEDSGEGEIKERLDMDDLGRELKAELGVM